jgi:murein DD-endopeptidase MepM/ murein hydrolase activator NlpD
MAIPLAEFVYAGYQHRKKIKRVIAWARVIIAGIGLALYLVIATLIAVIQGNGKVSDSTGIDRPNEFTEFQKFSYKTIYGERWYDYVHPYFFPTLGTLTQGVILDTSAKVGLKHVAWDIADRVSRTTEVKSFSDGMVVAVNTNTLYNTTRRWKFCDSTAGVCWYEVKEKADVQYACGYEVIIQHADSLSTQYCHLASLPQVNVGDPVTGGEIIGYQGSTGYATGKHLHFALWRGGQPIDPSYAFTQTNLGDW